MKNKQNNIRLRFAPSPTGWLHIGGLRSCLSGYLIAKNLGGKMILRIEDTDQARTVPGALEGLINILNWSGIEFDEGPHKGGDYGPYTQMERLAKYNQYKEELLEKGGAYPCFCTAERLEAMRQKQQDNKEAPRYDRTCRNLSEEETRKRMANGEKYVIRQKMPLTGEIKVIDELRGEIVFKAEDLDDQVLIKSDGVPTYHFASMVDDHLMEISHITRGEEWLPSFPKNYLLFQAFGWTPPKFIHLPLILNKTGGKLSKRQGDVAVEDYKAKGYLPEALLNFCALLGWHPKGDKEILSLSEIIKEINIKDIGTSPAVFDTEKLDYLNGCYIRQKNLGELYDLCYQYLPKEKRDDKEFIKRVLKTIQARLKTLSQVGDLSKFYFVDQLEYEPNLLIWKKLSLEETKANLEKIKTFLESINDWTEKNLEMAVVQYLKDNNYGTGDFLWPMRVALSGEKNSPGPFEIAAALGKDISLKRIQAAIDKSA
jgi:glutamyl-tRNA synthetase